MDNLPAVDPELFEQALIRAVELNDTNYQAFDSIELNYDLIGLNVVSEEDGIKMFELYVCPCYCKF